MVVWNDWFESYFFYPFSIKNLFNFLLQKMIQLLRFKQIFAVVFIIVLVDVNAKISNLETQAYYEI